MASVYAFVAARVGVALGCESRFLETATDRQLISGEIDVAFMCGLPYVRLAALPGPPVRAIAAPVIDEARYQGRPAYYSDVIVRAGSPLQSFADLRGRSFAYTQRDSFSGYVATRHRLIELGETEAFFGAVRYSGSHQASIRLVSEGTVDASAVDSHVLAVERRAHPEPAAGLRLVDAIGPAPIPPVVVGAHLPAGLAAAVLTALCRLGGRDRTRLATGVIRRFVPIDDAAYDDIRRKAAAVGAAPAWSASDGPAL